MKILLDKHKWQTSQEKKLLNSDNLNQNKTELYVLYQLSINGMLRISFRNKRDKSTDKIDRAITIKQQIYKQSSITNSKNI